MSRRIFKRVCKWLDVKEYLTLRMTGNSIMTQGSAYATFLYDARPGKHGWSKAVCKMYGVDLEHLPPVIGSADAAGAITADPAAELGLAPGTSVYGGGGDAELIGVGAGASRLGDTHIYLGTSGWVSTVIDRQIVDLTSMIGAIAGPRPGLYHYFAEMETSGKCLEWARDYLVLNGIGQKAVAGMQESPSGDMLDEMCEAARLVPPGSNGVLFAPWLHGNRCPFEDDNARGVFFNISLNTDKPTLIRSVLEGICYHSRWMLDAQQKMVRPSDTIVFAGGGASSPVICQILSDVLGREITAAGSPRNAGAAVAAAVGMGLIPSFDDAAALIQMGMRYRPNPLDKAIHDRNYLVFKSLYKDNRRSFTLLNSNCKQ